MPSTSCWGGALVGASVRLMLVVGAPEDGGGAEALERAVDGLGRGEVLVDGGGDGLPGTAALCGKASAAVPLPVGAAPVLVVWRAKPNARPDATRTAMTAA